MIRIVDMSDATSSEVAFSVWDTCVDRFICDKFGDYYWTSFKEFSDSGFHPDFVDRVKHLLPQRVVDHAESASGEKP